MPSFLKLISCHVAKRERPAWFSLATRCKEYIINYICAFPECRQQAGQAFWERAGGNASRELTRRRERNYLCRDLDGRLGHFGRSHSRQDTLERSSGKELAIQVDLVDVLLFFFFSFF